MRGLIFNVQRFSLHDGPGTRTTVFMKGCNQRCWWCHNPESWESRPELMFFANRCIGCGACVDACDHAGGGKSARFTAACVGCGVCAAECYAEAVQLVGRGVDDGELADELLADEAIYSSSGGGVTFSGGEPLLQASFLENVINRLKSRNVHIALETALSIPPQAVRRIAPLVDLIYADIKHIDSAEHRKATGVGNELILKNIQELSAMGKDLRLRVPVIPGYNDDAETMAAIGRFVKALPSRHTVELLAFHALCAGKYEALSRSFAARQLREPDRADMEKLISILKEEGIDALYRM